MAANCNILPLIIKKTNSLVWGIGCTNYDKDIVQNIIRNSGCTNIKGINYCEKDNECVVNSWDWDNNDAVYFDDNSPMIQD